MAYSELYNITQNITNFLFDIWLPDISGITQFESVAIILLCILCITLIYFTHFVYGHIPKKDYENMQVEGKHPVTKEPEIPNNSSWPQICEDTESTVDTVELSEDEDVLEEIHYAAARLNQKYYEGRCIALLKKCPQAVNYPMPPLMFTPFLRACWWGNAKVVEFMLKLGANVASHTKDGDSPIYLAVYRATKTPRAFNPACVNALYNAGCDINMPKFHGYTPLHLAAKAGNASLVCWLLAHGADPDSVSKGNKKPVDIANKSGHRKVVSLLTVRAGDDHHLRNPTRLK